MWWDSYSAIEKGMVVDEKARKVNKRKENIGKGKASLCGGGSPPADTCIYPTYPPNNYMTLLGEL